MKSQINIEETTRVRLMEWAIDYGMSNSDRKRGREFDAQPINVQLEQSGSILFGVFWE